MLTPENLKIYAEQVAKDLERFAKAEHTRWNAFMLTEGYRPATVEQMHQYAETVGSHKDDLSMLHPCIADWDALDDLQDAYNTVYGADKKFKKYDRMIAEKLPRIWEVAQQMNGGKKDV